ncbi:MauE/DoxX family redox-associated membrane protein [Actinomycetes bacterium KLBMP 9797]
MSYLQLASRGIIGFVMVLAVVGKLSGRTQWRDFQASLGGFGWIPRGWWPAVAALVATAEIAVVALLIVPATGAAGLACGGLMLMAVTLAVLAARRSGREVRCHCFGVDAGTIGRKHLARNALLVLVCIVGVVTSGATAGTPGPVTAGVLLGFAGIAAAMLSYPAELAFLVAPPSRRS